jgi:hypothetical protein
VLKAVPLSALECLSTTCRSLKPRTPNGEELKQRWAKELADYDPS